MRAGIHGVVCTGLVRTGAAECGLRGRRAVGDPEAEALLAHKMPLLCPGSCLRAWTMIAGENWCPLEVLGDRLPGTPLKMEPFQEQQPWQWWLMEPQGPAAPGAATEPVPITGISCLHSHRRPTCQPRSRGRPRWHRGDRKSPRRRLDGVCGRARGATRLQQWAFGEGSASDRELTLQSIRKPRLSRPLTCRMTSLSLGKNDSYFTGGCGD